MTRRRGGLILTSVAGTKWTKQDSGTSEDLVGIAGGNGQFIVVGDKGAVLRSSDASTWTIERITGVKSLDSVAWSGQVFVAVGNVGYGSVIARSPDGQAWEVDEFQGFNRLLFDVVFGGNRFVAVGNDIVLSPNGDDWTFLNAKAPKTNYWLHLNQVAAGNGAYVAIGSTYGGSIFTSRDGLTWRGAVGMSIDPRTKLTLPNTLAKTSPIGEKKELAREWRENLLATGLIGFAMSGLSLLLYIGLQIWAIVRTRGGWRVFSMLPIVAAAVILISIATAFAQQSNLWPLALIFFLPLVIGYLILLLIAHAVWKRHHHKASAT